MAIRKLVDKDHPVLRGLASPVKSVSDALGPLLDDMLSTMKFAQGVGLAAPQIGIHKQIIVISVDEENVYELINPRILQSEGVSLDVEGCLSIPGVYGEVPRAERVMVEALNRKGDPVKMEAEGLLSRVLQHEIDHLLGILFLDKALRLVDPEDKSAKGDSS